MTIIWCCMPNTWNTWVQEPHYESRSNSLFLHAQWTCSENLHISATPGSLGQDALDCRVGMVLPKDAEKILSAKYIISIQWNII